MARKRKRLTSISSPLFGLGWENLPSEAQVAENLVTFLEDRRILFVGHMGVYGPWEKTSIKSIQEIRERLGKDLEKLDRESELANSLRILQGVCRDFLNGCESIESNKKNISGESQEQAYDSLVKEFRSIFANELLNIGGVYGFDIVADISENLNDEQLSKSFKDQLFNGWYGPDTFEIWLTSSKEEE